MSNPFATGEIGDQGYEVKPGDYLSKIAAQHGHGWETLWNHPNNADLREKRVNPDYLLPGDRVFIPESSTKTVSAATDARHSFERKQTTVRFRVVFKDAGEPRAGQSYLLDIDGETFEGTLDGEGLLDLTIPANASAASAWIGEERQHYELELGGADPLSETTGVQQRLTNLGIQVGAIDGLYGKLTTQGVASFQRQHGLESSGEMNEETLAKIHSEYGS